MRVIYVAAPFRGPHAWAIENNIRLAESVGFEVAKLGAMPLIPHTNTRYFHGALPDEFWLEGTLALMYKCDAALFVGDWQKSSGCMGEHRQCELRGIPKFYDLQQLEQWLQGGSGPAQTLYCALCDMRGPFRSEEEVQRTTGGRYKRTPACRWCEEAIPIVDRPKEGSEEYMRGPQ